MSRRELACSEQRCGKGTCHGQVAMRSLFGFAPCVLPAGHGGRCDSGDLPPNEPASFQPPRAA